MIPEAAVEAALEAFYANCDVDLDGLHAVKAALEAAAPIIAAAVLNEAADRADEQEISSITPGALRRRAKSYRPAP